MPGIRVEASLEGKVVLITGAAGDIGRAAVRVLAQRGARIIAVDRRAPHPQSAGAIDPAITWLSGNVTEEKAVIAFVAETVKVAGGIDVLVNNAGIEGPIAPVTDVSLADFARVVAVNVHGVFLGMKHVIPIMRAAGGGSIVNMGSTAGLAATPNASAYIASKHAVIGLTRAAAAEWAGSGIRVNCVAPGPIEGRMMASITAGLDETGKLIRSRIPAGRFGTPDEVARIIAFLASEDSSHMHGAVVSVDGGRTAV